MADIAILVAEEYERRVRSSDEKGGAAVAVGDLSSLVSCAAAVAQSVKRKIGGENLELVKSVMEPKSQIGFAAFTGVFSA